MLGNKNKAKVIHTILTYLYSASCIRGHRVKKCNHSNRPLIRIQKRGRQVSQCTHCRDLRKSNKSHIKCTCATSSTCKYTIPFFNKFYN